MIVNNSTQSCLGRTSRGFTLIEMIIAMTLMGLIMVGLFTGLRTAIRSWDVGDKRAENNDEVRLVLEFLRRQLSELYPLLWNKSGQQQVAFRGNADALDFATVLPPHLGVDGLSLASIKSAIIEGKKKLVFSYYLVNPETMDFNPGKRKVEQAVLIHDLQHIDFAYYGVGQEESQARWSPSWNNPELLPVMIRVKIKTLGNNKWPTLIVPLKADIQPDEPQTVIQKLDPDDYSEEGAFE